MNSKHPQCRCTLKPILPMREQDDLGFIMRLFPQCLGWALFESGTTDVRGSLIVPRMSEPVMFSITPDWIDRTAGTKERGAK